MLLVGDDWAEDHHDVEIQDETGRRLGKARLPEGIAGITQLHGLIGRFLPEDAAPEQVVVGIETDRGGWVTALVAAGYQVFAVNPLQVARYRQRHVTSGAKSDAGDAHTLADMVRTDRHQLRPIAPDSALAEAVKVLARAHQTLVWDRSRQVLRLRAALLEFFPAALQAFDDLAAPVRWSCWPPRRTQPARRACRPARSSRRSNAPGASGWPTRLPGSRRCCAPSTWPSRASWWPPTR